MLNSLLLAIRFLILVFSGHKQVALENIALRHQLGVFTRENKEIIERLLKGRQEVGCFHIYKNVCISPDSVRSFWTDQA